MKLLKELFDLEKSNNLPEPNDHDELDLPSSSDQDNLPEPPEHDDENGTDTVTLDIPVLIRFLEWAKEEAKDDVAIHQVAAKLIKMQGKTISMQDYKNVIGDKDEDQPSSSDKKLSGYHVLPPGDDEDEAELDNSHDLPEPPMH
jgi:hypothetical protein